MGVDTLDSLEERVKIIDKYSKNVEMSKELEGDIASLTNKISLASEKLEINKSLNVELEATFKEVLKDAWNKVKLGGNLIIIEHNMMNPLTKKSVKTSPLDVNAHMLSNKECKKLVSILDAPIKSSYIVFWPKQLRFMQFADKMLEWLPLGAQYMVVVKKTK